MINQEGRDNATPPTGICRYCWHPILSATGTGRPLWVHANTRRATCEGGGLPIAEPIGPAPAVQAALFEVPGALRRWTPRTEGVSVA